jgi:hypothetical protein
MRTTGGTIYNFSSAVEDIGLNINERNNVVKISHFALLNIPKINEPDNMPENRFNVMAIPSALESWKTSGSIKDGRVIIAESFQNYALNLEANLLNQDDYDSTLSKTVSERVFWKWLKETGAIRWSPSDTSTYWWETEDADGSLGYNTVVKYFGLVSAGNVRQDSFGTYNETYALVPTSHGQMDVYFEQVEDTNYKHGMKIQDLGENILGRDGWTKPHPDGLSFLGYYDYVDSSTEVWAGGGYAMTANGLPGGWYSTEGVNPTAENAYMTDTSAYILSADYDVSIRYVNGGDNIEFKRSKVDCMGLVLDLNKLKSIYGDSNLTYDNLATEKSIGDDFEFNAVLIYYSVYNSVQDTILATNLLGVLFLDAPSGSTQNIGLDGILLPSLQKIQSGVGGFGTSYSLRLNIKSDNIVDDTAAVIVDYATSDQLYAEDWNQAFYELGRAVNILTQNNSVLQYMSEQYETVQANQTQMLNDLQQLQFQVNDLGKDIQGTAGTVAIFADGDDPLVDSSIYMKNGNIGFFNDKPIWPVQIDASLKTKDIYIEKAIKDTSGNNLLSWGSPLQLGSPVHSREISFYAGFPNPAIFIDTSNNVTFNGIISTSEGKIWGEGIYLKEASLGLQFAWLNGQLIVNTSVGSSGVSQAYVDGSLATIKATYIPSASTGSGLAWVGGYLTATGGGGGWNEASINQIWSSQSAQDILIAGKQPAGDYALNSTVNTAITNALKPYATNASIGVSDLVRSASLNNYVAKTGDHTMAGSLTINGNLSAPTGGAGSATVNLGGDHKRIRPSSTDTCAVAESDILGFSGTIYPKGNNVMVSTFIPIHPLATDTYFTMIIQVNYNGLGWVEWEVAEQFVRSRSVITSMTTLVKLSDLGTVVPGAPLQVKLRWRGTTNVQYVGGGTYGYGTLNIIDLY